MNKDTMRMCGKAKKKRVLTPVQVEESFWLSLKLMIHSTNNHVGWVNTEKGRLHLFYIKVPFSWSLADNHV